MKGLWEGPWCLGGDFTLILSPNERNMGGGGGGGGGGVVVCVFGSLEVLNEPGLKICLLKGVLSL